MLGTDSSARVRFRTPAQRDGDNTTAGPTLTPRRYALLRQCAEIRDRTPDGSPLAGNDARVVYAVLTNHPRAAEKIGTGVAAIVADRFVGGSRCFFVIRTDGSVIDFSARKCIGAPTGDTPGIRAVMARFPYARIVAHFRDALRLAVTR